MRIADKMGYEQVKSNLNKNRTDMANLQNQAATMKRITKPSDDPVGTTRTMAVRTDRNINEQYLKNINIAKNFIEFSEQALADVTDALVRAKELAISQSNDASSNEQTRKSVAVEIDQLYQHLVSVANRKLGDRFIFGGFKTTEAPFDMNGQYTGDEGEIQIEINKGVYVPINLSGDKIFMGQGFVFTPSWEKDPKDLPQSRPESQPMDGQEATQMRGPASVDSPQSSVETLDVRNSDSELAPAEGGSSQNGVNIFNVLKGLGTGLRTNDKQAIQESLDTIDQAINQVIVARSRLGSRVMTTDSTAEALRKFNVEAKTLESKIEDADLYELFTDINKSQSTLQSSLTTSGRMIQPSLLDFLK